MRMKPEENQYLSQFFGPNLGYVIEQFEKFLRNPQDIEADLRQLFETIDEADFRNVTDGTLQVTEHSPLQVSNDKMFAAIKLAEHIRHYGHLVADINPLKSSRIDVNQLNPGRFNLSETDLKMLPADIMIKDGSAYFPSALEAYQHLLDVYTKTIAYEFHHVHNETEKNWLIDRIENIQHNSTITAEKRISILKRLTEVEEFEKFLHKTFVGQKRFSIEGLDAMVPLIDEIMIEAIKHGAEFINIGMAHRGRLNVLAHVLRKPYEMIFAEFQHAPNKELVPSEGSIGINFGWTGDVKYHLGLNRQLSDNIQKAKITLANNPSHLEYVGAVVEGFTRAAQDNRENPGYPNESNKAALAILIHGDAAFPGEGIVAETLNLSRLKGYRTGGTIHIISNNMIGFTTESGDSRSTRYASDLAKGYEIPILHVNADDPEACLSAAVLAAEYRSVFKKDVLIDLIGYRRFGHNEMDEPMTTSPLMYTKVSKHPTVRRIYSEYLINLGIIKEDTINQIETSILERLKIAYQKVSSIKTDDKREIPEPPVYIRDKENIVTGVPLTRLKKMNEELLKWPDNFKVFHKLEKILLRRKDAFRDNGNVDWALAETLAFAAILADGTPIRVTGQDSERGTFAQRNLVLHDYQTGERFIPLHHLPDAAASFAVYNSPLTEAAVVGFEYGYNVFSPDTLVIWEAQYGDFANAAQVIFDQFIAAGRAKWGQKSGMVLLLPHGYEGQGPEHSSARLERFLQSAAEKNWTVVNLTSAAQYFHILRRQAALLTKDEIRPLVVMSPKSLLRNPLVASQGNELSEGEFKPIIEHYPSNDLNDHVERMVFCTGKMAIDAAEFLKDQVRMSWLQLLRIEEIYPFPTNELKTILAKYPNAKEFIWLQEEPKNMGAWTFVEPRINELTPNDIRVRFIGRRRRSSPAEGESHIHKLIQSKIITDALTKV
ncbi:2-oxoglutarate dehydrogenase E1 component [Bacillus sp. JJ1764]|uniref:2-oxoglutarate dehydrogenase E1 component n=1 Tax=Bacillus sp. JJ1764 TaxID=3122964 RepID=UPI002FFF183F